MDEAERYLPADTWAGHDASGATVLQDTLSDHDFRLRIVQYDQDGHVDMLGSSGDGRTGR